MATSMISTHFQRTLKHVKTKEHANRLHSLALLVGRRRRKPRNGRGHFTFFGKVVTGFGFFGGEAERESTETLAVVDMQTQLPGRSRWILKAWRASAAHREQA